jgi:hypothetical protein
MLVGSPLLKTFDRAVMAYASFAGYRRLLQLPFVVSCTPFVALSCIKDLVRVQLDAQDSGLDRSGRSTWADALQEL